MLNEVSQWDPAIALLVLIPVLIGIPIGRLWRRVPEQTRERSAVIFVALVILAGLAAELGK